MFQNCMFDRKNILSADSQFLSTFCARQRHTNFIMSKYFRLKLRFQFKNTFYQAFLRRDDGYRSSKSAVRVIFITKVNCTTLFYDMWKKNVLPRVIMHYFASVGRSSHASVDKNGVCIMLVNFHTFTRVWSIYTKNPWSSLIEGK